MAHDLTDAEIDILLERFDQTHPALQRRIIAEFVVKAEQASREATRLRLLLTKAIVTLRKAAAQARAAKGILVADSDEVNAAMRALCEETQEFIVESEAG